MSEVTRTLQLAAAPGAEDLAHLRAVDGIVDLRSVAGSRRVAVTYDLDRTGLAGLESAFAAAGAPLDDGFFTRLARRWAAFQEENRRAQSKIVHQCCNQPPGH